MAGGDAFIVKENTLMADSQIVFIGAGTAGCVLARRLVEMTGKRLALIAAGPSLVRHDMGFSPVAASF